MTWKTLIHGESEHPDTGEKTQSKLPVSESNLQSRLIRLAIQSGIFDQGYCTGRKRDCCLGAAV